MKFRKLTIDNRVKNIGQSEQTQDRGIKPNTIKTPYPRKQKKIFHKIKKWLKML